MNKLTHHFPPLALQSLKARAIRDNANPGGFKNCIIGSKVTVDFHDWPKSIFCIVVKLAGEGSVINRATVSGLLF